MDDQTQKKFKSETVNNTHHSDKANRTAKTFVLAGNPQIKNAKILIFD